LTRIKQKPKKTDTGTTAAAEQDDRLMELVFTLRGLVSGQPVLPASASTPVRHGGMPDHQLVDVTNEAFVAGFVPIALLTPLERTGCARFREMLKHGCRP